MQTTPLLIAKDDLSQYREISGNITKEKVDPLILDVHEFELRGFLGDDLYLDLLEKYLTDSDYQKLLDGENYEFASRTRRFTGIKSALCYFTLSLLVSEGSMHVTATGSYEKNPELATATSSAERQRVSNEYRERALSILNDARKYLDTKKTAGKFSLWRNSPTALDKPGSQPSIGRAHRIKNYSNYPRYINGDLCE